jgi:hypothetical protein
MIRQPKKRIYEYGSDYGEGGGRDPTAVYPSRMQVRPPQSRKEDQCNDWADQPDHMVKAKAPWLRQGYASWEGQTPEHDSPNDEARLQANPNLYVPA